ncbi:DUF1289 domain-containing protein [Aestuariirhabdus sp. LZHN29]|uniref:DUF1289 domain-containing protein n=1 Tax=Aestuariirhabdus sp. LZHN29 TaxID=3417462 RepID=UPI003CFB5E8F
MPNVPSPCVRNCCLDQNDICLGCSRSIDEITQWSLASDSEKRRILERAAQRRLDPKSALGSTGR